MEKNVYQLLQDWHELLKNGVITDSEFAVKKSELLGEVKITQNVNQKEDTAHSTIEEETQIDSNYELLFNKKTWLQKNKIFLGIALIVIIATGFIYYKSKTDNQKGLEIELKTNVSNTAAKEITLILENNKRIKLNKFPESDEILGELEDEIRDSAIRCFIDIDQDNNSELITQYFTGGAHCCYVTDIFIKISENTFQRIFSYQGEILIENKGVSLYYYEDIGYFNTCYACGVDFKMPFDISPDINLKFQKNLFEFAKINDDLNEEIEANLKTLKAKGIPNISKDDYPQDDGTRREYATNIITYYFNTERNIVKTKELFYNYYNHADKNTIWNELEVYLNGKHFTINRKIKFKSS